MGAGQDPAKINGKIGDEMGMYSHIV